jgi:DNA-binding transcriptional ArsR family regulator
MSRVAADATVFHAIADPTRRDILLMLRGGERGASELAKPFAASQSAISQHLAVLRRAGLVDARRAGRRRLYRVKPKPLKKVADWVGFFDDFWDEKFDALGRYLEGDA